MTTPYETLSIDKDATPAQIKAAYRKAARRHHPDKGGDEAMFKQIKAAYEVLSDEARRKLYDETGQTEDSTFRDESRLRQEMLQLVLGVMERVPHGDILNLARKHIKDAMLANRDAIRNTNYKLKNLEKHLARITCKSGENLLAIGIQQHIDRGRMHIDSVEKNIGDLEAQLGMLEAYEYAPDDVTDGMTTTSPLLQRYGGRN